MILIPVVFLLLTPFRAPNPMKSATGGMIHQELSEKRCGKCKKTVANDSKVGDVCPHCHVRWGYETSETKGEINRRSEKITAGSETLLAIPSNLRPSFHALKNGSKLALHVNTKKLGAFAIDLDIGVMVPFRAVFEALGDKVVWRKENASLTSNFPFESKHHVTVYNRQPIALISKDEVSYNLVPTLYEGTYYVDVEVIRDAGKFGDWERGLHPGKEGYIHILVDVNRGRIDISTTGA